jgi:hypothetical protein
VGTFTSGSSTLNGIATFNASGGNDFTLNVGSSSQLLIIATSSPTIDMAVFSNAGQAVNTAGASAIQVTYVGGTTSSIEASAQRIDLTPGSGTNSIWNGLRITGTTTATSSEIQNALKIEALPQGISTGTDRAIFIGTGWDQGLTINTGTTTQAIVVTASSSPTKDILTISNAGFGVATSGVSLIQLTYLGGTATSMEASAQRLDLTPGSGASSIWNGLRLTGTSTATTSITQNALKIDAFPQGISTGTDRAIFIGSGWDQGLVINGGGATQAIVITASSSPTLDIVNINNIGAPVATSGVSAMQIDYYGASTSFASLEASAQRINLTAGTSTGETWSNLRLVFNATSGVGTTINGIKFDSIATGGLGTTTAVSVGSNWMYGLRIAGTPYANATTSAILLGPLNLVGGNANGTYIGVNQSATTSDFINFQVSSTARFIVNATGTVMIGTSTASGISTTTMLVVCGLNTTCTKPAAASSSNAIAFFGSSNNATSGFSIAARGGIAAGQADIGEYINVIGADGDYDAGDILSVSQATSTRFEKSNSAYDKLLAGVVTQTAGFVAGESVDGRSAVVITLAGRVPVKVTNENGPIAIGDYLTSASASGYAMKATKAGRILGQALSAFDGTSPTGIVIVFVHPGYYNGPSLDVLLSPQDANTSSTELEFGKKVLAALAGNASSSDAIAVHAAVSEILTDRLAAGVQIIAPNILAQGLTVDHIGALDKAMTFLSDTIFIGRPYFTTDTGGFALVKSGAKSVEVTFSNDYLEQPIVNATISLEGQGGEDAIFNNDIRYLVTNKSIHGFTILLNKPAPQDIKFSWMALAVKGAKTWSSIDQNAPAPAPGSAPAPESITTTGGETTTTTATSSDATSESSTPSLGTDAVSGGADAPPLDSVSPSADNAAPAAPAADEAPPADSAVSTP